MTATALHSFTIIAGQGTLQTLRASCDSASDLTPIAVEFTVENKDQVRTKIWVIVTRIDGIVHDVACHFRGISWDASPDDTVEYRGYYNTVTGRGYLAAT